MMVDLPKRLHSAFFTTAALVGLKFLLELPAHLVIWLPVAHWIFAPLLIQLAKVLSIAVVGRLHFAVPQVWFANVLKALAFWFNWFHVLWYPGAHLGLCEDLDRLDQDVAFDDPEVRPRPEFHGFDVRFVRFEAVGITFSLYG